MKDGARTVAQAALVEHANARVYIVTNAVLVEVLGAPSRTDTGGIELVSVAVAVPFWDVCASALVDGAWSVADSASIINSDAVV